MYFPLKKRLDIFPCASLSPFSGKLGKKRRNKEIETKRTRPVSPHDPFYNETTISNTSVERRLV